MKHLSSANPIETLRNMSDLDSLKRLAAAEVTVTLTYSEAQALYRAADDILGHGDATEAVFNGSQSEAESASSGHLKLLKAYMQVRNDHMEELI